MERKDRGRSRDRQPRERDRDGDDLIEKLVGINRVANVGGEVLCRVF